MGNAEYTFITISSDSVLSIDQIELFKVQVTTLMCTYWYNGFK